MKHYYYVLLTISIFFMPYLKSSDDHSYRERNVDQEMYSIGIEEKIIINESCKIFINNVVEKAISNNKVNHLSQGLINCYEKCLQDEECQTMLVSDLIEALPELLEEFQEHMRAPRPGPTHEIAGSPTCDLSQVLLLLRTLQSKVDQCCEEQANCCAELISDFEQTFSVLTEINQSFSAFNETVAILIEATNTLTNVVIEIVNTATSLVETLSVIQETTSTLTLVISDGFNGTFTVLNACCNNITNDFNETWTILAGLNTTFTTIINNNATTTLINNGFNGTFTALNACCNNITNDFNETWTILASLNTTLTTVINTTITSSIINNGFNGTFTALNACCNNITNDFNETWTILGAGFNGTFSSIAAINASNFSYSVITDLKATISTDFNQTWTLLNAGFNGTFSALQDVKNTVTACCSTITREFQETWTVLRAGFNGTFSTLADLKATVSTDFNQTWTILGAGFNGTFSALQDVKNTVTACCATITREFQETWTVLRAGFNGTFSTLADLKATISTDFNQTWTMLNAGFNGTYSVIADLKATVSTDFNQTWTILRAGFNGTYSVIADLKATVSTDFNQTWTILNQILQNQGCVATSIITAVQVGTTGYTINQPGTYLLAENIVFAPALSGSSAITINASNVTLDLGCYGITQGNATANVNGILVNTQSNVNILNGSISSVTGNGIRVAAGSSNISLLNTSILTSQRGVVMDGTNVSPITNYDITSLELLGNTTAITFNFAQNGDVTDCLVRNSVSAGLELVNSYSNRVMGCSIENTGTINGNVFAVTANNGGNNIFLQNYIDNTSTLDTFSGNSANAIFIGNNENGDMITNNIISNVITTSNALPFGIQMAYSFTALSNSLLPAISAIGAVNALEWTSDGRYLATVTANGILVYELTNNVLINVANTNLTSLPGQSVSWSPDGAYLAVGQTFGSPASDLSVFPFNGSSFGTPTTIALPTGMIVFPDSISWSSNGKYIAICTTQTPGTTPPSLLVYEYNPSTTTPLTLFATRANQPATTASVDWCPTNPSLLAIGGTVGNTGTVTVLQMAGNSFNVLATIAFQQGALTTALKWSSDGRRLLAGGFNPSAATSEQGIAVFTFNGTSLTRNATFNHAASVYDVSWSPDNNYVALVGIASGGFDTQVFKFTGAALVPVANYLHGATVFTVDWSPAGNLLAIGGTTNANNIGVELLSALIFPSKTQIIGNNVSNINGPTVSAGVSSGRGISASSSSNLVIQNTAFQNDLNYVFATNIYSQFLANTRNPFPTTISNVSFPPL